MKIKKTLYALTALTMITTSSGAMITKPTTIEQVAQEVKNKDIVYFGEHHDNKEVHQNQADLLKELYKQGKDFSVGFEMVMKDYQQTLDDYLADPNMTSKELQTNLNWQKTWGYDFELYKPLFEMPKKEGMDLIALNAPRNIVRKVARQGLESLTEEDYKYVPKNITTSEEEYQELFTVLKEAHPQIPDHAIKRMYQAQCVWNETMAKTIVDYLENNPGKSMLVIAGDGHIGPKPSIPGRVQERAKQKNLKIETSKISLTNGDYLLLIE